jgi:hypothetical protein
MLEPPTPRVVAIAGDDHASRDRRSDSRVPWPPPLLSKPTAPRATAVATRPGVRRRLPARLGSAAVARSWGSAAADPRDRRLLARPRESPP